VPHCKRLHVSGKEIRSGKNRLSYLSNNFFDFDSGGMTYTYNTDHLTIEMIEFTLLILVSN
jgi:hypothetical protein